MNAHFFSYSLPFLFVSIHPSDHPPFSAILDMFSDEQEWFTEGMMLML
jgi:hypothetical protein